MKSDALHDIEFLWKPLLHEGKRNFLFKGLVKTLCTPTATSLQGQNLSSQEIAEEIKAMTSAVPKLNKIELKEIEDLREMKDISPNSILAL